MSRERRQWKNILINPERQVHYGTLFLASAIFVHAISTWALYLLYNAWQSRAIEATATTMFALIFGMIVLYVLLFGFAFIMGLVISHRIYGPLVTLDRHIEQLKSGDYTGRIVLRKNDDLKLKVLADNLNELTARLASQNKSR